MTCCYTIEYSQPRWRKKLGLIDEIIPSTQIRIVKEFAKLNYEKRFGLTVISK